MYQLYTIIDNNEMKLSFNPKDTSCGILGPVAYRGPVSYKSYHCVSLKNRFPET